MCKKLRHFSIIVDGTQDVSRKEQMSICVRYVDESFQPHEEFLGLYEPPSTTGEILSKCVLDVLLRLQLPLSALRGQTYDGASNMSGQYKGCQAVICEHQPLALYVHCGAHCTQLVAQSVAEAAAPVCDAMSSLQELGNLFSQSLKCQTAFSKICDSVIGVGKAMQIRPMCPTRWLVRVPAIQAVLIQYEQVLDCLEEMAQFSAGASIATRASGLLAQFFKGITLLALKMALKVFAILEQLNRSLQSRYQTVSGMLAAVEESSSQLHALREASVFTDILATTNATVTELNMEEVTMPRQRKPPSRFTGDATAHVATTITEHYRSVFYTMVDTAIQQLKERFSSSNGLNKYKALEDVLLTGVVNDHVMAYPEIDANDLQLQLPLFLRKRPIRSVGQATSILRDMLPEVRGEFSEVEALVRLLLVSPASSAEAERSFSALRRLKNWLRRTMTQNRLNAVAVCHVHQNLLDNLDVKKLIEVFVSRNDTRRSMFGYE